MKPSFVLAMSGIRLSNAVRETEAAIRPQPEARFPIRRPAIGLAVERDHLARIFPASALSPADRFNA